MQLFAPEDHHFEFKHAAVNTNDDTVKVKICGSAGHWYGKLIEDGTIQIYENGIMFLEGRSRVEIYVRERAANPEDHDRYLNGFFKRKRWIFWGKEIEYISGYCKTRETSPYQVETRHWQLVWEKD